VDEDDVGVQVHLREVLLDGVLRNLEVPRRELLAAAVEGVMEFFRDGVKILPAFHDFPAHVDAELAVHGHDAVQKLRHAAADRGGIDVEDRQPLQPFRQKLEFLDRVALKDGLITVKPEHGRPPQGVCRRGR
jgi:hypothetical protein